MLKVKQKDILEILRPYTLEIVSIEHGKKTIRLDDFLAFCIDRYKKQINAVNVSYKRVQK